MTDTHGSGPAGSGKAPGALPEKRNRLGEEKSPYLLQHRHNPVWWYPWGPEAFEAARKQDKIVFLSVGYSTCHWCHVMERESFEREDVAALLNESFISIKVDREERPDVDDIYMTAVQAMTGRGGWPMSVFLTPEGRPFFGGTYFPREQFKQVLSQLAAAWKTDRAKIEQVGQQLAAALAARDAAERGGDLTEAHLAGLRNAWRARFDTVHGGMSGAPKFPPAYSLRTLLRVHRRTGDQESLRIVRTTLDRMAAGGIYDHLGGGFARYSVDEQWLVPHFEKMLYDQAALVSAYVEAWQLTGETEYELVARETLDYVLRDMTHPDGGLYSAEDADSEGVEGKFYVWTDAELRERLSKEEFAAVAAAFGVTEPGNFEHGTNILHLQPGHTRAKRPAVLNAAMRTLFEARSRRVRPHLDDKVLTSWNGLMISALCRASVAFDEPRYHAAASRAARFLLERLRTTDGALLRRWREGEARFPAYLDDYAFLIDGLIELYQTDFDRAWIEQAVALQKIQDRLFGDPETGAYWFTDGTDATLLTRGMEFFDNVRPAGNSVAALNLLRLADLTLEEGHRARAARIFAATAGTVARAPAGFPQLLMALDYSLDRSKEIAIAGRISEESTGRLLAALRGGFNPNKVLAVGEPAAEEPLLRLLAGKKRREGKPTAYVCERGVCRMPTSDPAQAARLAGEMKAYRIDAS